MEAPIGQTRVMRQNLPGGQGGGCGRYPPWATQVAPGPVCVNRARHTPEARTEWSLFFNERGLLAYEKMLQTVAAEGLGGVFSVGDTLTAADLLLCTQTWRPCWTRVWPQHVNWAGSARPGWKRATHKLETTTLNGTLCVCEDGVIVWNPARWQRP